MATLCTLVASLAFYLILAGSLELSEIAAGTVVALVVATADFARRRCDFGRLRLHAAWARLLGRSLLAMLRDTATVAIALLRAAFGGSTAIRSGIARQAFRPGDGEPRERGRRAVVTLLGSLAPNAIVVDAPPSPLLEDEPALLVHHLVPARPSPDREWPV